MVFPRDIKALFDRFQANRAQFESPNYIEARVRVDFLNPMFACLGWDVSNRIGLPEAKRDVITEGRVKTVSGLKFPD